MLINKNQTSKKTTISIALTSLLMLSQGLISVRNASARVLDRAHGRCSLTIGQQKIFDGHCVMKYKENNSGQQVVVINLDNGKKYKLRGPNLDSLQIEAWDGIHNVNHRVREDKEVFVWNVDGERNRLVTRMDTKQETEVSVDNDNNDNVTGAVIGTLVGGLIGSLIGGSVSNNNSSSSSQETPYKLIGTTPNELSDLVGARAGQAEGELKSRGYTYRNTQEWDGGKTAYYTENDTGYCVEVGTVQGRYSTIVYNSSDRCRK